MEKASVTVVPSRVTLSTTSSSSFNGGNSGAIVRRLAGPPRIPRLRPHNHTNIAPYVPSSQTLHHHHHRRRYIPPTRTTDTLAISPANSVGVPKERRMIPWKKKSPWSSVWGVKNGSTRDVWCVLLELLSISSSSSRSPGRETEVGWGERC
jgi:hypothetical protein